jgi:uncharacterized protein YcnI
MRSPRHAASTVILILLSAVPALAHVTVWPQQSRADASERYTVRVPTEGQVTTTAIELEIPANVTITGVLAPAGFSYETVKDGNRTTRIIWHQDIKAGEVGEFVFFARNPSGAGTVMWKAHQRFADGSVTDWIGPAGDRRPAPTVRIQ